MTGTGTTTTETLSSPPPSRRVPIAAGLTVFAAVALTPWLLTTNSEAEPSVIRPTWPAASPQQPASGLAQASARSYAPGDERLAAYALFCQNSPVLCAPPALMPPNAGYVLFCQNSPVLCTAPRPH
jgi:hypothetical protein